MMLFHLGGTPEPGPPGGDTSAVMMAAMSKINRRDSENAENQALTVLGSEASDTAAATSAALANWAA